ncbi:hypothetical protein Y1Q_0003735 [Alligator mississippiensis]|uniref:DDE Tnp4 domain-containing protein n=1 Tax=Alligator mississippiensis TaxID=8496 RepID=A0A151MN54_ALLMI|nr:hypothetical protein Y1Q_0003735 [Alligator mississippiensis]
MAITVMTVATCSHYHDVTNQFSMGKTTAKEVVWKVSLVIKGILANCFIHLISPQEVVTSFYHMRFPNIMGAEDSNHISILCLCQATQALIKCKGYFSVVLQGIIKHHGRFNYILAS